MKKLLSTAALAAILLPGVAASQPVLEPWMARPMPQQGQPPMRGGDRVDNEAPSLEPIDLPPAIEQGVDMIYIDEELVPRSVQQGAQTHDIAFDEWTGAPVDLFVSVNPIYTELRRSLMRYQQRWSELPQVAVPAGPTLKAGVTGERVNILRQRLGLAPGAAFDAPLGAAVTAFQAAHGLKADGIAGAGTIDALNRGARHYEQLIIINMERAKRLPAPEEQRRYVLVDVAGAQLYMYENGRLADQMKVIVGSKETATPMMAALIKYSSVNPYWNVPPELVRNLIGPRVVAQGISYLTEREYQVLSDWSDQATVLDPSTIDWRAVVAGQKEIRLRRLPSPANSMGMIKFMLPNSFGIYLHDTPEKSYFAKDDRWISNGCIRLEDARRFARWLYGAMPKGRDPKVEEDVALNNPVPTYMTYLTVFPGANGPVFRADPYGRDTALMSRFDRQQVAARAAPMSRGR